MGLEHGHSAGQASSSGISCYAASKTNHLFSRPGHLETAALSSQPTRRSHVAGSLIRGGSYPAAVEVSSEETRASPRTTVHLHTGSTGRREVRTAPSIDAVSPPVVDRVGERVANLARRTDSRRFARETPANSRLRPQLEAWRAPRLRRGGVQVLVPVCSLGIMQRRPTDENTSPRPALK